MMAMEGARYESLMTYPSIEDRVLSVMMNEYCMCDLHAILPNRGMPMTYSPNMYDTPKEVGVKGVNIPKCAEIMEKTLKYKNCSASDMLVKAKRKHERQKRSNRRSNFIGVSKNGPSWQAMITVNRYKTYIGTYKSEKEAAVAFDFYSMLIHNLVGKTNFSYTKGQVCDMLENFLKNNMALKLNELNIEEVN